MPLEETVKAIRAADRDRERRVEELRRLRAPIARVDAILQELEELHLRGGVKVPALMIERIEHLLDSLPGECRVEFPLRTKITRVMDNLYQIQDCLLSRKDRERSRLQEQDSFYDEGDPPAA